ncbi:MAG TPA: glycoside hydrolase family 43 protein [Opitutaceae bacterium]|nr:glycoside hydrolase family 43 protein [Opitutaceae bacterium]
MKTLIATAFSALTALLTASAAAAPAPVTFDWFEYTGRDTISETPLKPGEHRNPILAGFYPDPSICRVGDDYYLVNSTFGYFPGIPIFHSRDLVNWKQLGHVIDRAAQLRYDRLGVTRGIFAPALSHHGDTFYLVCTMIDAGGNFLVTAKNPAGPWSDPIFLGFDGIDPSLFFDDDGRAWMVNNGNPPGNKPLYSGHRAIWIQEFDIAARKMTGPRSIIVNGGVDLAQKPVWIEGPHLYKRDGWYYLCCAEGGTSDQHSQVILRSKSPTGPFAPWDKNPILTQRDLDSTAPHAITCTGHADFVVGPDGNWWSVFLACRPFAGKYFTTGRETFLLPVRWTDDGWPVILPPGQRVPHVFSAPKVANAIPQAPSDDAPLNGNFTWRDDFSTPALSPLWIMLRAPKETWWSLTSPAGRLALTPRTELLAGRANPSFLARRLQHARFDATIALTVPAETGVSAGVAAFQNETHFYYFGVRRTAGGLDLFLECANGKSAEVLASAKLGDAAELQLRITGEEKNLSFAYATAPGQWQTLVSDADTTPITVQAAGGGIHFTGAVIGPHARIDP